MKIIALQAENVKKLRAVEIRPNGNMVEITGRNGQGKTSVLDAIWWALAGATHIQTSPIRKGANEARIRLDMGEIKVTRTFKRGPADKPGTTTGIVVENADGARFPSPQKMLDALIGELSFDPLAFARMDAKQQFDVLRRFVPDVDFAAIDAANAADYDRRRDINRQAKEKRAAAGPISDDAPAGQIDEAALVTELEAAGQQNADIEKRTAQRQAAAEKIAADAARADELSGQIEGRIADIERRANARIAKINEEIERLQAEQNEVAVQAAVDSKTARDTLTDQASALRTAASELRLRLDAAPSLPAPVDTAALRQKIADARENNAAWAKHQECERLAAEAEALEVKSKALTDAMAQREADKAAKIAAAKLPVEGMGFGAEMILMNGEPFDQASSAERLRASVAIAMSMNPKVRVIRVEHGNDLDEDGMRLLAEMADAADCQVWIERVDNTGRVGFVIEDGAVRDTKEDAA